MSFTAKYSFYMKDKLESSLNQGGGLLGSAAPLQERIVGHAVDISYRWKIISDLSIYLNYGMFVPGDAYFENEPLRHFTMAGLVMSFYFFPARPPLSLRDISPFKGERKTES